MEGKKGKIFASFLLGLVVLAIAATFAFAVAPSIEWTNVYLNSHFIDGEVFSVERGTVLNVKVLFETGVGDSAEVKVKAWIDGYRETIQDETERFDIFGERVYSKNLYLNLPKDMEEGLYTLHVLITSKTSLSGESEKEITLAVQKTSYKAEVLSVDIALPAVVEAGKNLGATTVVKNRGSHKLEDIYVRAEIPELGIVKTVYIGDLYPQDYSDNTERDTKTVAFSIEIPKDAKSGTYTLKVTAYNLDASAEAKQNFEVKGIREKETETEKIEEALALTLLTKEAKVKAGESMDYEIAVINPTSRPYTIVLEARGVEGWARASFNPQTFTVSAKDSKIVKLTLNVESTALEGTHVFSVNAKVGENIIASTNLMAEVEKEEKSDTALLAVIIVLAVIAAILLVILIVLIVRQSRSEERPEEIYY